MCLIKYGYKNTSWQILPEFSEGITMAETRVIYFTRSLLINIIKRFKHYKDRYKESTNPIRKQQLNCYSYMINRIIETILIEFIIFTRILQPFDKSRI